MESVNVNINIAKVISLIFEPIIVLSLLVAAGTFHAGLDAQGIVLFLLFALVVMIIPIVAMRFWFVRVQGLDWDIKDRKARILPLFVLFLFIVMDVFLVSLWNNTFLNHMFSLFLAWTVGYLAITLFWKISGHTSVITLASLLVIDWYGWKLTPLFAAIAIVTWARVAGKYHTLSQAVGGIVYSTLLHEIWKSFL